MSVALAAALAAVLAAAVTAGALVLARRLDRRRRRRRAGTGARIAFPFLGQTLSDRALGAAIRLARAQDATLVPVYLALVPRGLPLDAALPRQAELALGLMEEIEQRAARAAVPVELRIERGRTPRHAVAEALSHESFARVVVPAATASGGGFAAADVAWLLDTVREEVVVVRPEQAPGPGGGAGAGRLRPRRSAGGPGRR